MVSAAARAAARQGLELESVLSWELWIGLGPGGRAGGGGGDAVRLYGIVQLCGVSTVAQRSGGARAYA